MNPPDCEARTIFPNKRFGYAFPYVNFAGRGFRYNLGARPRSDWDLSSKIHDIMYFVNDISFSLSPPENLSERSRLAKADYIFRQMNKQIRLRAPEKVLNRLASLVFLGRDRSDFRGNDSFTNVINLEEINPNDGYFMIPWSSIPESEQKNIEQRAKAEADKIFNTRSLAFIQKRYKVNTRRKVSRAGGKRKQESPAARKRRICDHVCDEIKFNTRTSLDDRPWRDWAQEKYGSAWTEVLGID